LPEPPLDFCADPDGRDSASTDPGRAGRVSPILGRAGGTSDAAPPGTAAGRSTTAGPASAAPTTASPPVPAVPEVPALPGMPAGPAVPVALEGPEAPVGPEVPAARLPPLGPSPSPEIAAPAVDPEVADLERPRPPRDPRRRRLCPVRGEAGRELTSSDPTWAGADPSPGDEPDCATPAPADGPPTEPPGPASRRPEVSSPVTAGSDRGVSPLCPASALAPSPTGADESAGTLAGFSTGGPVNASDIEFPFNTAHDARSCAYMARPDVFGLTRYFRGSHRTPWRSILR
jgi:hypothetical protein